jgi:hypothetical protein
MGFNDAPGSRRIDDPQKAEEMARASKDYRDQAAAVRANPESAAYYGNNPEKHVKDLDESADRIEENVGARHDIKKENPGLDENEVARLALDKQKAQAEKVAQAREDVLKKFQ